MNPASDQQLDAQNCSRSGGMIVVTGLIVSVYGHRVAAVAAGWISLKYIVTLGNVGRIDFQASKCIPMGFNLPLPLMLTLGVGAA